MKTPFEILTVEGGKPNVLGYARVSTVEQSLDSQLHMLEREGGCSRIWTEKVSSMSARPGWNNLIEQVRPGDEVVVLRLDRIGRRLNEIVNSVTELIEQGVRVRALQQGIDTGGGVAGKVMLAVFGALAEAEREAISERTKEGLAAARKKGKHAGRPVVLTKDKEDLCTSLAAAGYNAHEIAAATKMSDRTVRRALARAAAPSRQVKLQLEEPERKPPTKTTVPRAKPRARARAKKASAT